MMKVMTRVLRNQRLRKEVWKGGECLHEMEEAQICGNKAGLEV